MEVYNVPKASDNNIFAEIGKSETFTEYHGIPSWGGRKKGRKLKYRGQEISVLAGYA